MSERIDFVLFSEHAENVRARGFVVEQMMASMPAWFEQPTSVMRLNHETGEQTVEKWETSELLSSLLNLSEILFIYAKPGDRTASENSLAINANNDLTVYTLSIEKAQLLAQSVFSIEQSLVNLVNVAIPFDFTVMFAGSEVEWCNNHTTGAQVLNNALKASSESYWIMAKQQLLASFPKLFEIVESVEDYYLLRRRDVLLASGFNI